jgi:hypothetical protein
VFRICGSGTNKRMPRMYGDNDSRAHVSECIFKAGGAARSSADGRMIFNFGGA